MAGHSTKINICGFSKVSYWHGLKGGMDVHGRIFSEGLAGRGHHVTLISTRHSSGRTDMEKHSVRINFLPNTTFGSRRRGWSAESKRQFLKFHRQKPFDIIWSQSFDGFGMARLSRPLQVPIVATIHGSIQQEIKTFKTNLLNNIKNPQKIFKQLLGLFYSYFIVQKPLLESAHKIVTVSRKVASDLEKWFGPTIARKCETIYNGIDTNIFKPNSVYRETLRSQFGIGNHEKILLTLGRLTFEKGSHIALEATKQVKKRLPAVKLFIVGDGEIKKQLETQVKASRLEKDVFFIGSVENDETVKYYNAADIFLMPTLTVEGLPLVLLEAMACVKPVIASRIGGNAEVISDGINGLLFQPGDVNSLAEKILVLLEEQALSDKLSCAARKATETRFNCNHMMQSIEDILDLILSKRAS
jgi:glycosyltransferase involved in cell wall biosynthesis